MRKIACGYRLIFGYLGMFIIFIGVACFTPLLALIAYPKEATLRTIMCFVGTGTSAIVLGFLLFSLIWKREKGQLKKHQDAILLVLIWLVSIFISSVPFMFKENSLGFTDAIFETTSAFATTGLSIFRPIDYESHIFVLYRSILSFLGGVGLVLIITSAISDRYGLKLYVAEGHNDKLMPNLAKSARLILSIYSGIIVFGAIMFSIAGMPVFDAIIHSISAVATAGFSSRPEGLMYFSNQSNFWAIQTVAILLMILGSINFLIHMFIITGKFKKAFRDCEIKLFLILSLIFIPLFFIAGLCHKGTNGAGKTLLETTFTFISSLTTTGFSNVADLTTLGEGVLFLAVIANSIGGGMGSTSGGFKLYRLAVAGKSFYWSTKEKLSSSNLIYPHYIWRCGEQKEVSTNEVAESFGYILLYIATICIGAFLITIFDTKWTYGQSIFEFSNALSSTGLTIGLTAAGNAGAKWVLIFGMFAGRLEILALAFACYRLFKDIFRKEII